MLGSVCVWPCVQTVWRSLGSSRSRSRPPAAAIPERGPQWASPPPGERRCLVLESAPLPSSVGPFAACHRPTPQRDRTPLRSMLRRTTKAPPSRAPSKGAATDELMALITV